MLLKINMEEVHIELKDFPWECKESDFLNETEGYEGPAKRARIVKRQNSDNADNAVWSKSPSHSSIAEEFNCCPAFGKGPANNVSNPLEAWNLLFDLPMLEQLVKLINQNIKSVQYEEAQGNRLTDITEIRSWLGLNYLAGVLHNSKNGGCLDELWTLELGNSVFRATMSFKRFTFLSECLCFPEEITESEPRDDDIETVWEQFFINSRSYYSPSVFCVVDDFPIDFEVRKAVDDKLRLITLCDAKTLYIYNASFIKGTKYIVEDLFNILNEMKVSQRCLCINEHYTNLNSFVQLSTKTKLKVIGPLTSTTKELPAHIIKSTAPQIWYSQNHLTIISNCDKKISSTGLLLTNGLPSNVDGFKLYKTVTLSNKRAFDKMKVYSASHANVITGQKNYNNFLQFLMDIAAMNAWILMRLSINGDPTIEQRNFQRQLGLYLTQQQLKKRLRYNKLSLPLKLQLAEILGEDVNRYANETTCSNDSVKYSITDVPDGVVLQSKTNESRRRCKACKKKNGTKIKTRCQQCLLAFCTRHLIFRCEHCTGAQ